MVERAKTDTSFLACITQGINFQNNPICKNSNR